MHKRILMYHLILTFIFSTHVSASLLPQWIHLTTPLFPSKIIIHIPEKNRALLTVSPHSPLGTFINRGYQISVSIGDDESVSLSFYELPIMDETVLAVPLGTLVEFTDGSTPEQSELLFSQFASLDLGTRAQQ